MVDDAIALAASWLPPPPRCGTAQDEKYFYEAVGARARLARQQRRISTAELARATGIWLGRIADFEIRGRGLHAANDLVRIADGLLKAGPGPGKGHGLRWRSRDAAA